MADDHVGPYQLDGVAMPTWLLRFDKNGNGESPRTLALLLDTLDRDPPTDLIFFSHGWNNDFAFAGQLYRTMLGNVEAALAAHPDPARRLLFVGVVWPSILLPGDPGPVIAGPGGALPPAEAAALDDLADRLPDIAGRLRALAAKRALADDEASEVAQAIGQAIGDASPAAEGAEPDAAPDAQDVIAAARAIGAQLDAPPLTDDFGGRRGAGSNVSAAGLAWLNPVNLLRVLTVYQMKDRAGAVGANGVRALMRDLLAHGSARVHAVGHSYGAKVMLSALCAGPLPRPLESLLLLQPAISHLCFADVVPGRPGPGGYRAALGPDRVIQPILTTYSRHDIPLHDLFHVGLRRRADLGELGVAAGATSAGSPPSVYAALGGYGPRGAGETLVDPIPASAEPWPDVGGARIVGLDGTKDRRIGGHGDVTTPIAAGALARQILG
ncbi:MAG TPA: hypothetical protein VMS43_07225 [Allosphingosinicella sp.]|nr:hypothetical protein [Allosphingosinicella sp.]